MHLDRRYKWNIYHIECLELLHLQLSALQSLLHLAQLVSQLFNFFKWTLKLSLRQLKLMLINLSLFLASLIRVYQFFRVLFDLLYILFKIRSNYLFLVLLNFGISFAQLTAFLATLSELMHSYFYCLKQLFQVCSWFFNVDHAYYFITIT